MGDLREWSPELNGAILEETPSSPPSPPRSPSDESVFSSEFWESAEDATRGIIAQVQPTVVSEERRKAVIDYVQTLVKTNLGCEVYPFGSVPLKTFLPDGDIDLTAFGALNIEEALANGVCSVLEREDQNGTAQFVVKDVQLIRAEVKLVKCLVQNIVVDISFNQLGGLCTLCFLEKVDRLIGKDHLFKRSIILIKAWCYYESRILGAHHGLISTYALETLVLYVFHLFHSSLNGPLAVLYKFLDYFSKFDWDNYCISLNGPIRLSSLPEFAVETPENGGGDLLLTNDFLKECLEMYSVPLRGFEMSSRTFPSKHLNIVDPLRETNNLGRSVSKGNFYRIRSAFTYGARKLDRLLSQSQENIAIEIHNFFSNTLDRHGSGQRPDVQDPVPAVRFNGCGAISPVAVTDSCQEDKSVYEPAITKLTGITGNSISYHEVSQSYCTNPTVSEKCFVGNAEDLTTIRIQRLTISDETTKCSPTKGGEDVFPLSRSFGPIQYRRNGEMLNGALEQRQIDNPGFSESKADSGNLPNSGEGMGLTIRCNGNENLLTSHEGLSSVGSLHPSPVNLVAWPQEDIYLHYSGQGVSSNLGGEPEASNLLSDLSGDYDSQLNSLQYGHWWFDYVQNGPLSPMSSPLLSQYQGSNSWEVVQHAMPFGRNMISPMNANGAVQRQVFFSMNPQVMMGVGFGMEEMPKPRGTGTYFPNANHYRDRPYSPRGRNQYIAKSPRNNGRVMTQAETNWTERSSREPQFFAHQIGSKNGSLDVNHSAYSEKPGSPGSNGSMHLPDRVVEFGSIRQLPLAPSSPVSCKKPSLEQRLCSPGSQRIKPNVATHQDRVAAKSYHLKDEGDFPPLSM